MHNIAFLSFVFPAVDKYLDDFFVSLQNQTIRNFDVYIINDGLDDFSIYREKYDDLNIIDINCSASIPKNREFGINLVLDKKYDFIFFGDSDDYFSPDRIECVIKYLQSYDIVVNDLNLVNENRYFLQEYYLSNRVKNEAIIDLDFVKERNLFGFSNTAIRGDIINKIKFDDNLIALDWYFFSFLLLKNKCAIFTNGTTTNYRQHSNNIVGFKELNEGRILRAIEVKLLHYQSLVKQDAQFKFFASAMLELFYKVSDPAYLKRYIGYLNENKVKNPLWWEEIKIDEVEQ